MNCTVLMLITRITSRNIRGPPKDMDFNAFTLFVADNPFEKLHREIDKNTCQKVVQSPQEKCVWNTNKNKLAPFMIRKADDRCWHIKMHRSKTPPIKYFSWLTIP